MKQHIRKGTKVFTDEHLGYFGLDSEFAHQFVNHAEAYAEGEIHTNGLENYWSLLKRGIGGTYVSVEPFHLFRYMDEQAFRYNSRNEVGLTDKYGRPVKKTDSQRMAILAQQIVGKRLTYERLTGKDKNIPF